MPPMNDSAQMGGAAFEKAASTVTQGLAQMYKLCHQASPDSPLCDALQNMLKAVAEIETQYQGGGGEPMPPGDPGQDPMAQPDMGAEMAPAEEPTPPMGGNPAFAQAAQETGQMMADAARKRRA